jgi:hypothetical protein
MTMEKQLEALRQELEDLLQAKHNAQGAILPSERDALADSLNFMAGRVLAGGGSETVLRLVLREIRGY